MDCINGAFFKKRRRFLIHVKLVPAFILTQVTA